MSGCEFLLDYPKSYLSKERIQYMIKRFRELGENTEITYRERDDFYTLFSEEYSCFLFLKYKRITNPGELLVYKSEDQTEAENMVDITQFKAKDFNETETINGENCPTEAMTITRVEPVPIKTGPRAGQDALVIELDGKWTYWPNRTSVKNIAEVLGNDSDKWINKKIKISTEKTIVRGARRDVLYAEPIS